LQQLTLQLVYNLAVYETEPVESRLDIYWETSTSGTIRDLNEQVDATGGQTIFSTENFNFEFNEYWGIYDPTTPWDPVVQGSPEPGGAPAVAPTPDNGELGRYRSVVCGPIWFEDTTTTEIQDVTVVSFTVTDGTGIDVTSDFDLLQIKGTSSSPPGPGNYIDYTGVATTTYSWDTFIIVNKSYRLWQTSTPLSQEFNIELQVTDDSVPSPAPIKTFTYTPLANGTEVSNLPTIQVGGRTYGSAPQNWGQNPLATVPSPPILDYDAQCPPLLIVDYGILGTLVEFYGMNGANYGNPASIPASNNQVGLQWSIDTVTQGGASAVGIFALNPTTGELTEVSPGTASGKYSFRIKLTGPDGTFHICLFDLIVGVAQATGSFSTPSTSLLFYDDAYVFNLHNSPTNAYANMSTASFNQVFPGVSNLASLPAPLNGGFYSSACGSTTIGGGTDNNLLTYQVPFGGGPVGPLTQGTGYIWLDIPFEGRYGTTGSYNSCDISWAIEYRPSSASAWLAATDIEGQPLSFNSSVTGSTTNPWQSERDHQAASANASSANAYDQRYGCKSDFIGSVFLPSNNFVRATAQQSTTGPGGSYGEAVLNRIVAVGNSPTYGIPAAYGEYRVVIQRIGGTCTTCQSCGSSGPKAVSSTNPFVGQIKFGDFFYDLGPQRAFGYRINPSRFSSATNALSTTSHTQLVYAREPVHRYVSTFYTTPDLDIPYTGYTGTGTFISYIAAPNNGTNYTSPLNAGTTSIANITFAKAAEGAARNNAIPTTTQNLRVWTKELPLASSTFTAGTAQANRN